MGGATPGAKFAWAQSSGSRSSSFFKAAGVVVLGTHATPLKSVKFERFFFVFLFFERYVPELDPFPSGQTRYALKLNLKLNFVSGF